MVKHRILIADDEEGMLEVCRDTLEVLEGVSIVTCSDGEQALEEIRNKGADLLVTDLKMPGMSGVDLLRAARELDSNLPVLIMTAHPRVETAVEALRLGAADYLTKPFHPNVLLENARRLLEELRLRSENRLLGRHVTRDSFFGEMVGRSEAMTRVYRLIEQVASGDAPVLIAGPTGTGKELVARSLHHMSPRSAGNFVPVNCGAIPESLIENEFFGHEAGAFTGAVGQEIGLIEYADGGTLLLDEITELPMMLQVKLLRVLQEKRVRRISGKREIPVDIRVVAATNQNIEEQIKNGRFREDLYYRLNVVRIDVPPLRERTGDVALLAEHFLHLHASDAQGPVRELDEEALQVLTHYDWPGNVRQLQNTMRRVMSLSPGPVITADDLPEDIVLSARAAVGGTGEGYFEQRTAHMDRFDNKYFRELLEHTGGKVSQAADLAGVPRGTMYRLLNKYSINPRDYR